MSQNYFGPIRKRKLCDGPWVREFCLDFTFSSLKDNDLNLVCCADFLFEIDFFPDRCSVCAGKCI